MRLRIRRRLLSAVLIGSAGYGAMGASESAAEPAELAVLSGDEAALLSTLFKTPVPVLVAGAGGNVVAIVFDEDPDEAARLREDLFSTDPVAGCDGDAPVACCDMQTGKMVLRATYAGQSGWVQMGELCEVPGLQVVDYVQVPEEVSLRLKESFGVDYCLMELAGDDGTPLVLVNGDWGPCVGPLADANGALQTLAGAAAQGGALWLAASIMRAIRGTPSPITLVTHNPPPAPPRCPSDKPDGCMDRGYKICREGRVSHWYKENAQGDWCLQPTNCGPCDDD